MINISKINHLKFIDIMADIFKKPNCKPTFQPPPPPGHHHHCRPNTNININNDDNGTSDSSVSPIIVDLINRINKVENRVDDVEEDIDLSKVEIGEESGQAYPGEKGAKNALEIELLKSNLILKADKTEIPNPEIYYVDNFNEEPSISGLYITEKEARFWNGSEWCNITINTVSSLSGEVNDNYVPTAKAVVNALSYLNNEMDKYATDEEVNSTVEIKVQEAIHEKLDNEDYSSLLNSINNFKNSI